MGYEYGKKKPQKKSVGGKLSSIFKKAVLGGILATSIGVPAYSQYGTIQTQEIRVTDVQQAYLGYDREARAGMYDYKVVTESGTFENDNSPLHLKFNAKEIQGQLQEGEVYKIQYYGFSFAPPVGPQFAPNILSVTHVTAEEIAAREEAAAAAPSPAPVASNQPQPVAPPQSCLTGEMTTYTVTVNGNNVQISVPTEVVGKVTVNRVQPLPPSP